MEQTSDKRVIVDENGNEYEIEILLDFEIPERGKKYAVICKDGDEENAALFILVEDEKDNFELYEIEDEDEYNEACEIAEALLYPEESNQ